jgi:hypothetical protein
VEDRKSGPIQGWPRPSTQSQSGAMNVTS